MRSQRQQGPTPPGQLVDVGGFRLHAIVRGEGTPTVVLESGLGGCALQFTQIQPAVSAFARVLAYDRAGQAWSDPSPDPRTPAHVVSELRTLLGKLHLMPPYVFVGHSFGGLLALIEAGSHPEETAGVVTVDSSDVEQYATFPSMERLISQTAAGTRLLKLLSRLGLGRQMTKMSLGTPLKFLPKEVLNSFLAVCSRPTHYDSIVAEFSQMRCYFGPQSEVPHSLGEMPLSVVTAGKSVSGKRKFGGMTADELNSHHQHWQAGLARRSSQGQHIVVRDATHLSILFEPEKAAQVVEAIRLMLERARDAGRRPAPIPSQNSGA